MVATIETRTSVKFTDVGRNKMSWTAMILLHGDSLDYNELLSSVRKHGKLGSSMIDITDDGHIVVGPFSRVVGKWEIEK